MEDLSLKEITILGFKFKQKDLVFRHYYSDQPLYALIKQRMPHFPLVGAGLYFPIVDVSKRNNKILICIENEKFYPKQLEYEQDWVEKIIDHKTFTKMNLLL